MKTKARVSLVGVLIMGLAAFAQDAPTEDAKRIGIYDSRSIAIAFVGSAVYQETQHKLLASKMAERKEAKEKGDRKKVEEIEAWGRAQQDLLHKQGFSTAPVDDILAHISDQLPEIKKQAKVDLLVSKWDAGKLATYGSAEKVDVTMRLIEAFKPIEKQKKSAIEIQKLEPVPPDKMKDHNH